MLEALVQFKSNNYDLVILDYYMPALDGLSLHSRIRDIDKRVKVLILTASVEDLHHASKDSNFYVLRKPVKMRELLEQVNPLHAEERLSEYITNYQ